MNQVLMTIAVFLISLATYADQCDGFGVYQRLSQMKTRHGQFYNCHVDMNLVRTSRDDKNYFRLRIFAQDTGSIYIPVERRAYLHAKWPAECQNQTNIQDRNYYSISKVYEVDGELYERFISIRNTRGEGPLHSIRFGERHYPSLTYRHIAVCGPFN